MLASFLGGRGNNDSRAHSSFLSRCWYRHVCYLYVPVTMGVKGEMRRLTFRIRMDELKTTPILDAAIQHGHRAKARGGYRNVG